jgi:hypothetical protein
MAGAGDWIRKLNDEKDGTFEDIPTLVANEQEIQSKVSSV